MVMKKVALLFAVISATCQIWASERDSNPIEVIIDDLSTTRDNNDRSNYICSAFIFEDKGTMIVTCCRDIGFATITIRDSNDMISYQNTTEGNENDVICIDLSCLCGHYCITIQSNSYIGIGQFSY